MNIQTSALIEVKCLRTTCTRLAIKKPKLFKQVTSPYRLVKLVTGRSSFTLLQNSGIYKLS